ncbi:hypothetical protein [Alterisphingorhabdus coralli]|uniref:MarR family transcriptional regulator n=1 Tax=Alterisphingorhabdus coralli TaxID=3071408 RepID=A0AA97F929_9SPHN|nr:hypothetical protein [Parasphingorhabdus sp. SCSIO 66989]WOE76213.1 hypothetical protein RB602_05735 [Parasphingorhabdus sp. SCSIO 66989]
MTSTRGTWRGFPKSPTISVLLLGDDSALVDTISADIESVFETTAKHAILTESLESELADDSDLIFLQCDRQVVAGQAFLAALAQRPVTARPAVIIQCSLETLDDLFLLAEKLEADILIGPDSAERIVSLTSFARRTGLREGNDDTAQNLRELNEKIADFAKKIERFGQALDNKVLTDSAPPKPAQRGMTGRSAVRPDNDAFDPVDPKSVSARKVRQLIAQRRMRDRFFDGALFADPAWDILLDLYAAHLEEVSISVSSLCIAAAVPPTTALRWVSLMTRHGILERKPDDEDKRRVYIVLSQQALTAISGYFAQMRGDEDYLDAGFLPGL